MAAQILKSLPKESKDDGKTYILECSADADNLDGFIEIRRIIIAESSAEAIETAKKFVRELKRKKSIFEVLLFDPKASTLLFLRKDDVAKI